MRAREEEKIRVRQQMPAKEVNLKIGLKAVAMPHGVDIRYHRVIGPTIIGLVGIAQLSRSSIFVPHAIPGCRVKREGRGRP